MLDSAKQSPEKRTEKIPHIQFMFQKKKKKKKASTIFFRSSHQRCSTKKSVLRNFAKFTGKHLRQSLFFNQVACMKPATLLKKRL